MSRVLLDEIEEHRQLVDLVELAGQGGGEVEPEAVDVHLGHPVTEGVHDELEHVRATHEQAVARAGRVVVVLLGVVDEPVVRSVVDAPEAQRRSELVALGGVVVHDVEDDLDVRLVQGFDHGLELVDLFAAPTTRIAVVRGEEADRVVTPVVGQALGLQ
jgi:hypothetical protein